MTRPQIAHSNLTHLPEYEFGICYDRGLLKYEMRQTTEIYTHISKRSLGKIKSPLDRILRDKKHDNNNLQD